MMLLHRLLLQDISSFNMHAVTKLRSHRLLYQGASGQGHLWPPAPDTALGSPAPDTARLLHQPPPPTRSMDPAHVCLSSGQREGLCPVCLQTTCFPVQTNCGHLFCAPCLMAYWRHGTWLDPISCPLCRQKVSSLCRLFNNTRSDQQTKAVLGDITDYNKRYSGAPRRMRDYLCDTPLLLQLVVRHLATMGGLVWLFFLRVVLCCVGAVVSIATSSLPSSPLKAEPSLCGLLGVLDDLVVVSLLLLCVVNVNQQMAPERAHTASTGAAVPSR
ncbi:RING-HC_RNF170 domain-containing protein [Nerophis ophidion]|uniref:RING-HC_RNF170 domain-containing protein n=1 Tax=Nerophis ophidion TaxID=159077 RepID=UPI002AE05A0E|nr:RING-HC_RNF170 domain-containing protein [Nerophis ophidion]XP_061744518.1 RING-HC_RNF170 domain-containing protein [Nerophis ophidion]